MVNCNNVEENFIRNFFFGEEMKIVFILINKIDYFYCDGLMKDGVYFKGLFCSVCRREVLCLIYLFGEILSDKEKKLLVIKFSLEEIDCKGDVLFGNGWWNE